VTPRQAACTIASRLLAATGESDRFTLKFVEHKPVSAAGIRA
jgi:predicted methyltransferase